MRKPPLCLGRLHKRTRHPESEERPMEVFEAITKGSLAAVAIVRLTRAVWPASGDAVSGSLALGAAAPTHGEPARAARGSAADISAGRVMDVLSIFGVWVSAQAAVWVACGFVGVLFNWFLLAGTVRLMHRSTHRMDGSGKLPRTGFVLPADTSVAESMSPGDGAGAAHLCL